MASAVLRKRVSIETFEAPPLKRLRSSLTSTPSNNISLVQSFNSQLPPTDNNISTASHKRRDQCGTKRKRKAKPAKPQRLHSTADDHQTLADEQLTRENVDAPKREHHEVLEAVRHNDLINMEFDLNDFFQKFPDPQGTFDVTEPEVTEIYSKYTEVFLKNEFPSLQITYIKKVLKKSGFHLTPAYNALKADIAKIEAYRGDTRQKWYFKDKFCMHPRSKTCNYPQGCDVPDQDFFWERLFVLNQEEILGKLRFDRAAASTESFTEAEIAAQFEKDVELVCEIHPEVDLVYIRDQLALLGNDLCRVSKVIFDLYGNFNAPKREHREALELVEREYERLNNMKFDLNEFFQRYPDPLGTFDVREPDVTEIYCEYAEVFLKNEFRSLQIGYIKNTLQKSGFHLTPAYNELKAQNAKAASYKWKKGQRSLNRKYSMHPRSETFEYPQGRDVIDEEFFWERLYILNQEAILGRIAAEKEAKQLCLEEARRDARLNECTICVSSEVLLEDMVVCQNEHLFCKDCVQHSTEELLGQGCASFPCLEAGCGCHYTLATLEKALRRETYSLVLRRVQSEEIRLADIEDMVSCPFCPYAVVICEDVSSSVLHCENPDCMVDSCRKCKEVAHPPYSCEEFKLKKGVGFKHFMENQMAEAMIRICPKCDLRFIMEDGASCHTITCTNCLTSICYACRKEFNYKHLKKNPRCRFYIASELHKEEITAAFEQSDTKYREQHPDLRNSNIVFAEYNLLKALKI